MANHRERKRPRPTDDNGDSQRHSRTAGQSGGSGGDTSCDTDHNAFDRLDLDTISNILSYVGGWEDVLKARVCRRLREGAMVVPIPDIVAIDSALRGRNLLNFARVLPMIHRLEIGTGAAYLRAGGRTSPLGRTSARVDVYDVDLLHLSHFHHLKHLRLGGQLIGTQQYPDLFQIASLEHLDLGHGCGGVVRLKDLSCLPNLKVFMSTQNGRLAGDLESLLHLKDTLEVLRLPVCRHVSGTLLTLADFPLLRELHIPRTGVTGDIRDIRPEQFPSLQILNVQGTEVYGGRLSRIGDAPAIMAAYRRLMTHRRPFRCQISLRLDHDSPDNYSMQGPFPFTDMPSCLRLRNFGPRWGYQWTNPFDSSGHRGSCEINWLDPEPYPCDEGYREYCNAHRAFQTEYDDIQFNLFRGLAHPPTEREWNRLIISPEGIRMAREWNLYM
mmetsp:Transcript_34444/g.69568  ORF Transcript_34444/g.69568 Transcript_34444/m.69568 type:complete len:441 (+) Transcript_34444:1429-2751(+)